MRLDKYLKVARIIKRRTLANEACDASRVSVNDKVARASYEVKIGDIIEIRYGTGNYKIEVCSIKESAKKEDAISMYRELDRWLILIFRLKFIEIKLINFPKFGCLNW